MSASSDRRASCREKEDEADRGDKHSQMAETSRCVNTTLKMCCMITDFSGFTRRFLYIVDEAWVIPIDLLDSCDFLRAINQFID